MPDETGGPQTITLSAPPALPRLAYSTQETAEVLGLSIVTVRRLIAKGRLRTIRGIRHRMVPVSEIQRLLTV